MPGGTLKSKSPAAVSEIFLDIGKHKFARGPINVKDGDSLQLKRLRTKFHKDSRKFVDIFFG